MKSTILMLLPVLGLALASVESRAQSWPTKPRAGDRADRGGQPDRHCPARGVRAAFRPARPDHRRRQPSRRGHDVGLRLVAKAAPDGYTLLATSSAHAIAPALYPALDYRPVRDFVAVVPLGVSPFVLVVPPDRGFKTARDLVTAAKARPGAFNFASPGVGSASHLSAERFRLSAGVRP